MARPEAIPTIPSCAAAGQARGYGPCNDLIASIFALQSVPAARRSTIHPKNSAHVAPD